jgi:hypothetical protein
METETPKYEYPQKLIPVSELRLADVVRLACDANSPWATAIVQKIDADSVTFFRPYGTTADFEYTGGVITYIGTETFTMWRKDSRPVYVYERRTLR